VVPALESYPFAVMGVTLGPLPWHEEANRVHQACHSYAQGTWETDPEELCAWVRRHVPGGHTEAWLELVNGEWIHALDVSVGRCRYRVESLVAQYRAGKELIVVEP
jgi:hypothetical protein